MNELFNYLIDMLKVGFGRLLELPVTSLVLAAGLLFATGLLAIWIGRKHLPSWLTSVKFLYSAALLYFALLAILMIDQRMNMMHKQIGDLRGRLALTPVGVQSSSSSILNTKIKKVFPDARIMVQQEVPSITYASIRRYGNNPAQIHLALIDLTDPNVRIEITREKLDYKTFTSAFAKKHNCIVAINGEAGVSPAQGRPLGQWTGNWIANGNKVLLADSAQRPFLSFDRTNHARYYRAEIVDTRLSEEKFNTIWGRFDLLLDGESVTKNPPDKTADWLNPRTAMGIDETGKQLFLAVIDGRQSYSFGMKTSEVAQLFRAIGAYNAMSCDQGGSSCMYLNSRNGIVNWPSDGQERPVYSHFGVSLSTAD